MQVGEIQLTQLTKNRGLRLEALTEHSDDLRNKLTSKQALVGVIGCGYVGLPLSITFNQGGFQVLGFEKDEKKAEFLNDGVSYIQDVAASDLAKFVKEERFSATTNFSQLSSCDVIVICVPTPLAKSKEPDMSFIVSALEDIANHFRPGQLIILESTTFPGTTREVMMPRLNNPSEGIQRECGKDYFLAFSPERVDPGNEKYNTYNTPKVVGGITDTCTELACLFYSLVMQKVVQVGSPETAEMVKLLENTFRAVNIGLVNEVAIMCEKLGVDVWEVIEAAATKPFGFMPFYPGPGLGGHCIPIDPTYLSWKLKTLNYHARFIELATAINSSMPGFCIEKIADALNRDRKPINGSKILIMGIAYKNDIDDLRESPALDVIHILKNRGADLSYYDPFIPEMNYDGLQMKSVNWSNEIGKDFDLVVITTNHSAVDYTALLESSKRIVDTRNALKNFQSEKIIKL